MCCHWHCHTKASKSSSVSYECILFQFPSLHGLWGRCVFILTSIHHNFTEVIDTNLDRLWSPHSGTLPSLPRGQATIAPGRVSLQGGIFCILKKNRHFELKWMKFGHFSSVINFYISEKDLKSIGVYENSTIFESHIYFDISQLFSTRNAYFPINHYSILNKKNHPCPYQWAPGAGVVRDHLGSSSDGWECEPGDNCHGHNDWITLSRGVTSASPDRILVCSLSVVIRSGHPELQAQRSL